MWRLFLFSYPWYLPRCLGFAAVGAVIAASIVAADGSVVAALGWGVGMAALPLPRMAWGLLRFGLRVRRFQSRVEGEIVLRCAPAAAARIDVQQILRWCNDALTELTVRLQCSLKRRLTVFVFDHQFDLSRFFARHLRGCALPGADAIIVAADGLLAMKNPEELLHHEIAHLLSRSWGRLEPALKSEGLATWAQGTIEAKPVDSAALADLLSNPWWPLWSLLPDRIFYQDRLNRYAIAGSFTGFVIRRFGLEAYRRWFRKAKRWNFESAFKKAFGLTLTSAERQWRRDLLARRKEFEPDLGITAREQIIISAYNNWQFVRCLDEFDGLVQLGKASSTVYWYAASAQGHLGNFEEGIKLLDNLLQNEDGWVVMYKGSLWLQKGQYCDLQGQREEAIKAYQRALEELDCWYGPEGSSHRLARQCLAKPFTEDALVAHLKTQWKQAMQSAKKGRG
jgi:tetratricopeptide (TPR) repeat protein